ncbi:MAG: chalcone isomerase family protein [Deltaproteobacteria bacterium]|nr:chalcone isomerase family protein [Deltaproteobacteria bacterium]
MRIERREVAQSVVAMLLVVAGPAWAAGEIREPETNVAFPAERRFGPHRMRCVGTAVREKFGFDVYAACLYVDAAKGKAKLLEYLKSKEPGAYAGGKVNVSQLQGSEQFFRWLIASDLAIAVDMTFVREVAMEKIKAQWVEGLAHYLQDAALRDKFVGPLSGDVKKYEHLTLTFFPGGKVQLQQAGRTYPAIVSQPLARALLSIWLGHKPVTAKIKRDLVKLVDTLAQ